MLALADMGRFVETWKQIAALVGRSERWCRYSAGWQPDPLPVIKIGGIVRLYEAALDAWIARRAHASLVTVGHAPTAAQRDLGDLAGR